MLVVLVYVDDIIVTGSSSLLIEQLISSLNSCFALKDLSPLNFFLGIEVLNSRSSLHLSQAKYICDFLQRAGLSESKSMASPMAAGPVLSIADGTRLEDPTLYRSLVGALQYCTITRPDIAYTVNKLCQFMHAPTSTHLQVVKRVLRYLKGSLFYGLSFQPSSSLDLIAYTDADWASCPDDRRSTSGYCIFFGGNLVSWSASKQKVVSRSSTESEYRGLANAAAELTWIQSLLKELFIPLFQPPVLYCDNLSTTYLAANPILHSRAKHVEIDYHFVRERVLQKTLDVRFLPSEDQVADILTKSLSTQHFLHLRSKLTVLSRPVCLRGDVKKCSAHPVLIFISLSSFCVNMVMHAGYMHWGENKKEVYGERMIEEAEKIVREKWVWWFSKRNDDVYGSMKDGYEICVRTCLHGNFRIVREMTWWVLEGGGVME
uniref:Reverse transcriptase Ty1/copia-type domain-containing protein n=1 Tax=Vitis vinifera TaxID=29760 RepID=A5BVZ9_VITVI|nr:hypothetical protein VITISV_021899 [Vitis vinifera]